MPDYFSGALEQLAAIKNDTYTGKTLPNMVLTLPTQYLFTFLYQQQLCLVNKKELTPAAKEFLAEQTTLRLEYDLYNHIRTRLVEQMRRLGIKPESV